MFALRNLRVGECGGWEAFFEASLCLGGGGRLLVLFLNASVTGEERELGSLQLVEILTSQHPNYTCDVN